jgi:hypothetical protein
MKASEGSHTAPRPLFDCETLEIITEAFENDSGAAESFAQVMFDLRNVVASWPQDTRFIETACNEGIKMAYLYSDEHKLAFQLYELYLTRHLKPNNEPRVVLEGALESGALEVKQGLASDRRREQRKQTPSKETDKD